VEDIAELPEGVVDIYVLLMRRCGKIPKEKNRARQ
jgi:hypothetical protein